MRYPNASTLRRREARRIRRLNRGEVWISRNCTYWWQPKPRVMEPFDGWPLGWQEMGYTDDGERYERG